MDTFKATEQSYKNGYEAGVKDLAERLKDIYESDKRYDRPNAHTLLKVLFKNIDNLAKELTEGKEDESND